jgi:hypothetical protein
LFRAGIGDEAEERPKPGAAMADEYSKNRGEAEKQKKVEEGEWQRVRKETAKRAAVVERKGEKMSEKETEGEMKKKPPESRD